MSYINEVLIFRLYIISVLVTFFHEWFETVIFEFPNLMCSLTDLNQITMIFLMNFLCMMISKCLLLWSPITFQAMNHERVLQIMISVISCVVMTHSTLTLVKCGRIGQKSLFKFFSKINHLDVNLDFENCILFPIGSVCLIMVVIAEVFWRITNLLKNIKSRRRIHISKRVNLNLEEVERGGRDGTDRVNGTTESQSELRSSETLNGQTFEGKSSETTSGISKALGPTPKPPKILRNNFTPEILPNRKPKVGLHLDKVDRTGNTRDGFVELKSCSYKPGNLTGIMLTSFTLLGILIKFEFISSTTVLLRIVFTVQRALVLFQSVYWVVFNENSRQYLIRKVDQILS